jgi:hypothetical protein
LLDLDNSSINRALAGKVATATRCLQTTDFDFGAVAFTLTRILPRLKGRPSGRAFVGSGRAIHVLEVLDFMLAGTLLKYRRRSHIRTIDAIANASCLVSIAAHHEAAAEGLCRATLGGRERRNRRPVVA